MLHITTKHTGKMEGMQSISTSVTVNPYCLARIKNKDSVCSHCYANTMMKRFDAKFEQCFVDNADQLTSRIIPDDELPIINAAYFRFESFGDIINWVHVANYFNICRKNPNTRFALWTKNPWLLIEARDNGYDKPDNLKIVQSSVQMNKIDKPANDMIDLMFTVYTKKYVEAHTVPINCGKRKCIECLNCYKDGGVNVNELQK